MTTTDNETAAEALTRILEENDTDNEAGMLAHIDDLEDTNKMLLEALKAVVADYQFSAGKRPVEQVYAKEHAVMKAIAAIAKAEGK